MTSAMLGLLLAVVLPAQADVEPDFLDDSYIGKVIRVDGVISTTAKKDGQKEIRLQGTRKVRFLTSDPLAENIRGNVEIVGRVVGREKDDLTVEVESFRSLPADAQRFDDRRKLLDANDYRGLLELSRWAAARDRRYTRPEMAERALKAYIDGVALWRMVERNDPAALRSLKTMLERDKILEGFDFQALDHQIAWAESLRLDRKDAAALTRFAEELPSRLGVSVTPRPQPLSAKEQAEYMANPVATFNQSLPPNRPRLVRFFQALLLRDALQAEVAVRGIRDTAYLAREKIPDYPEQVAAWFRQWAELEEKRLDTLSRQEVAILSETIIRELGDSKRGQRVLDQWLSRQEDQLRRDRRDTGRRMELARLHEAWRGERGHADAVRMAEDAVRFDPKNELARSLLREITGSTDEPAPVPLRPDGINVGMKADAVLQTLGPPTRQSRIVTRNRASGDPQIHHYWAYGGLNETFWIILEQAPSGDPTVVTTRSTKR